VFGGLGSVPSILLGLALAAIFTDGVVSSSGGDNPEWGLTNYLFCYAIPLAGTAYFAWRGYRGGDVELEDSQ
jgi:hypothetical protein